MRKFLKNTAILGVIILASKVHGEGTPELTALMKASVPCRPQSIELCVTSQIKYGKYLQKVTGQKTSEGEFNTCVDGLRWSYEYFYVTPSGKKELNYKHCFNGNKYMRLMSRGLALSISQKRDLIFDFSRCDNSILGPFGFLLELNKTGVGVYTAIPTVEEITDTQKWSDFFRRAKLVDQKGPFFQYLSRDYEVEKRGIFHFLVSFKEVNGQLLPEKLERFTKEGKRIEEFIVSDWTDVVEKNRQVFQIPKKLVQTTFDIESGGLYSKNTLTLNHITVGKKIPEERFNIDLKTAKTITDYDKNVTSFQN